MSPSDRLKPVKRVADSRERDAARQLGDSQRALSAQRAKLDELRRYQAEYRERFEAASRSGISAQHLREYQTFLAKLGDAIRQQEEAVAASERARHQRRDEWQQQHTRSRALGKAVERLEAEENREQQRREQKESDDRSQRPKPR